MKTIFIYILIFHCFIYNKLIIPIYKKTYNYNSIESFIFNNYLSNISIGNPQQKIECNIRLDSPQFIIKSKELNGIYNKNLSNSYYSFDNTLKTYFWGKSAYFVCYLAFFAHFDDFQVVNFGAIDGETKQGLDGLPTLFSCRSRIHGEHVPDRVVLYLKNMTMTADE